MATQDEILQTFDPLLATSEGNGDETLGESIASSLQTHQDASKQEDSGKVVTEAMETSNQEDDQSQSAKEEAEIIRGTLAEMSVGDVSVGSKERGEKEDETLAIASSLQMRPDASKQEDSGNVVTEAMETSNQEDDQSQSAKEEAEIIRGTLAEMSVGDVSVGSKERGEKAAEEDNQDTSVKEAATEQEDSDQAQSQAESQITPRAVGGGESSEPVQVQQVDSSISKTEMEQHAQADSDSTALRNEDGKQELTTDSLIPSDNATATELVQPAEPPSIPGLEQHSETTPHCTSAQGGTSIQPSPSDIPKQPYTGEFISLGSSQVGQASSPKHDRAKKKKKLKKQSSKDQSMSPVVVSQCDPANQISSGSHVTSQEGAGAGHMTSNQIQSEILQIDSILKALNTGTFDAANMVTISHLTVATPQSQVYPTPSPASQMQHPIGQSAVSGQPLIGQSVGSGEESSGSSDSESTSESSDDSMGIQEEINGAGSGSEEEEGRQKRTGRHAYPRTKGEIDPRNLPPVEECDIPFPENGRILPIATVSHITEKLVVMESLGNTPPVNEGTVLWSEEKKSIAKTFETFGPVKKPYYSVLVNSAEHAHSLGLSQGKVVYVVPGDLGLTHYVFTNELMRHKGSDASWKHDMEVPEGLQEYSDDENEMRSGRKKRGERKRELQSKTDATQQQQQRSSDPSFQSTTQQRGSYSSDPSEMKPCFQSTTAERRQPLFPGSLSGVPPRPFPLLPQYPTVQQPFPPHGLLPPGVHPSHPPPLLPPAMPPPGSFSHPAPQTYPYPPQLYPQPYPPQLYPHPPQPRPPQPYPW